MFKDKRLDLNEYTNVVMSVEDGTLTIRDASIINDGKYQCFAKNKHGEAMSNIASMTHAYLASYLPNVSISYSNKNAGEHLTIPCQSTKSVPAAIITWTLAKTSTDKNPTTLQLDKRINQDERGKYCRIPCCVILINWGSYCYHPRTYIRIIKHHASYLSTNICYILDHILPCTSATICLMNTYYP